jgi:hypothetical protein
MMLAILFMNYRRSFYRTTIFLTRQLFYNSKLSIYPSQSIYNRRSYIASNIIDTFALNLQTQTENVLVI